MTKNDVKNVIESIEPPARLKYQTTEAVLSAKPSLRRKKNIWASAIASVLVLCVAITGIGIGFTYGNYKKMAMASANEIEYLSSQEYYEQNYNERLNIFSNEKDMVNAVNDSLFAMTSVLHSQSSDNQVGSPLAVFMMLGMLQEMTDGETQQEITDFLGLDSNELREVCKKLYSELYCNTEMSRLLIKNSSWFNKDFNLNYDMAVANTIADNYYADIFEASFSKNTTKRAMSRWLKDNSDGAFGSKDVGSLDSVIKLFSVVDFMARWGDVTNGLPQQPITFKNNNGEERSVDGLSYAGSGNVFFVHDKFTSGAVAMENGYEMVFVKPNEQFSVEEIMADKNLLKSAISFKLNTDVCFGKLKCQFPLFNIETEYNLKETVSNLGMEKMFLPDIADFGAIAPKTQNNPNLYVSDMILKAYIETTKNGCKAGAMARADIKPTAGDPNADEKLTELTLTLDQPFIFAIVKSNMPIFTGVVQNP